ncbi:hypothetical protein [Larkinella ripae]
MNTKLTQYFLVVASVFFPGIATLAQEKPRIGLLLGGGYPFQKINVLEYRSLGRTRFIGFDFAPPFRVGVNFEKRYAGRLNLGFDLSYLVMRQSIKNSDRKVVMRNYYDYSVLSPYLKVDLVKRTSLSIGPDVAYLLSFRPVNPQLAANPIPTAPYIPTKLVTSLVAKAHFEPIDRLEVQLGYYYRLTNFSELSPIGPRPTALFYSNYLQLGIKYGVFKNREKLQNDWP